MPKIHPDSDFEKFTNISEKDDINTIFTKYGAFPNNASFYTYLAALGFKEGKILPTKERSGWGEVQGIRMQSLECTAQIFAIALGHAQDYSILKDEDECYEIFEGYVNAGFKILKKKSKNFNDGESFVDSLLEELRAQAQDNKIEEDPVQDLGSLDLETKTII